MGRWRRPANDDKQLLVVDLFRRHPRQRRAVKAALLVGGPRSRPLPFPHVVASTVGLEGPDRIARSFRNLNGVWIPDWMRHDLLPARIINNRNIVDLGLASGGRRAADTEYLVC